MNLELIEIFFNNIVLYTYSYKCILYITITIIKKTTIVFSVATLMYTYRKN